MNRKKPGTEQFDKMNKEIANMIIFFTGMVRRRLKPYIRFATIGLLTSYVYFRDILNGLIRNKVFKADDFKWQMQFKFEMKNMQEVVQRSAFDKNKA